MRTKLLFTVAVVLMFASCEKQTKERVNGEDYSAQFAAMQQLVERGMEYDITTVAQQIGGTTGYWQVDAVLGYNADFSQVVTVYRNFADIGGEEPQGPIVQFGANSQIVCYDLGEADGRIVEQRGEWNYEPRGLVLALYIPQFDDNNAVDLECKLLSLSPNAIVLEWVADGGEALRASLIPASMSKLRIDEANCVAEILMAACRDFDKESFAEALPGTWTIDSELEYDDEWQRVVGEPYLLMGEAYGEGGAKAQYLFEAEGEGVRNVQSEILGSESSVKDFTWTYDVANSSLTLTGDEYNAEYIVSGYNDDYVVLDYNNMGMNIRMVLKRKA